MVIRLQNQSDLLADTIIPSSRKFQIFRQKATLPPIPNSRFQFIFLQAKRVLQLAGDVVLGNLHVKGGAGVAQVLTGEDGTLLTDEKGGGICVACLFVRLCSTSRESVMQNEDPKTYSQRCQGRWTDQQP